MEPENPDNLPLIERINKAEYLARELCEHLQQTFLPKLVDLRSSSKKLDPKEVSDQTMYDKMAAVVSAEKFSDEVFSRLSLYLDSIQKNARDVLGIDESISQKRDSQLDVDIQDVVWEE